eukprot:COSAG02_NODE_2093_length_9852_cov_2.404286_16_plen_52_part_00
MAAHSEQIELLAQEESRPHGQQGCEEPAVVVSAPFKPPPETPGEYLRQLGP